MYLFDWTGTCYIYSKYVGAVDFLIFVAIIRGNFPLKKYIIKNNYISLLTLVLNKSSISIDIEIGLVYITLKVDWLKNSKIWRIEEMLEVYQKRYIYDIILISLLLFIVQT